MGRRLWDGRGASIRSLELGLQHRNGQDLFINTRFHLQALFEQPKVSPQFFHQSQLFDHHRESSNSHNADAPVTPFTRTSTPISTHRIFTNPVHRPLAGPINPSPALAFAGFQFQQLHLQLRLDALPFHFPTFLPFILSTLRIRVLPILHRHSLSWQQHAHTHSHGTHTQKRKTAQSKEQQAPSGTAIQFALYT